MSDATGNVGPEAEISPLSRSNKFTFTNFTEQEKNNYIAATITAYHAIYNALDSVETSTASDEYSKWFQAKGNLNDRKSYRDYVVNGYTKMVAAFEATIHFTKDAKECKGNVFAWSILYDSNTRINLCSRAFNDGLIKSYISNSLEWARAFIVVHEISHIKYGTEDNQYDWGACADFARSNPDKAVANAQNYALFAMKLLPRFGKILSLCASNGKYLSIKPNGSLFADKEKVGEQEKFEMVDAGGYFVALKSVASNRYVTTDTGLLTASATMVVEAEKFRWLDIDHDIVAFRSMRNSKLVSLDSNAALRASEDAAKPEAKFKFHEVGLSYRRIKASLEDGSFLGYLDMKDSAYCEAVIQANAAVAHRYKWHKGGEPFTGRLDQRTSPSDRSFTYSGSYPCWGLGENWIWLFWDEDTHLIWQDKNEKTRTLCYNGKDLCFGDRGDHCVRLEFDPADPGAN